MKLTDQSWTQKWSKVPYSPIHTNFIREGFGSHNEPQSSLWMASLCKAMGNRFKENMKVLDYGCGSGRLANFLSGRLKKFHYYGVEPRQQAKVIETCKKDFPNDDRIYFGQEWYGNVSEYIIGTAEVAVLGSVFTHLLIPDFVKIMDRLLPIVMRGGIIVFSIFLHENLSVDTSPHPFSEVPNCYFSVNYTNDFLDQYELYTDVKIVEVENFNANGYLHHIMRVTGK
jgi:SAM-dependent methyltransferase